MSLCRDEIVLKQRNEMELDIGGDIFKTVDNSVDLLEVMRNSMNIFKTWYAGIEDVGERLKTRIAFLQNDSRSYRNDTNSYTESIEESLYIDTMEFATFVNKLSNNVVPVSAATSTFANNFFTENGGRFGTVRYNRFHLFNNFNFNFLPKYVFLNSFYRPRLYTKTLRQPLSLANVSVIIILSKKINNYTSAANVRDANENFIINNAIAFRQSVSALLNKSDISIEMIKAKKRRCNSVVETNRSQKIYCDINKNISHHKIETCVAVPKKNLTSVKASTSSIKNQSDSIKAKDQMVEDFTKDVSTCVALPKRNLASVKASTSSIKNQSDSIKAKDRTVEDFTKDVSTCVALPKSNLASVKASTSSIKNQSDSMKAEDRKVFIKVKDFGKDVSTFTRIKSTTTKRKCDPVVVKRSNKRSAPDYETYKTNEVKKIKVVAATASKKSATSVHHIEPDERLDNTDPKWQWYKVDNIADALNLTLDQWQIPRLSDPHLELTVRFNKSCSKVLKRHKAALPRLNVPCTILFDTRINRIDAEIDGIVRTLHVLYQQYYVSQDYNVRRKINQVIEEKVRTKHLLENQYGSLCNARFEINEFYKFYKAEWISQYQQNQHDYQRKIIQKYEEFYKSY